MARIYGTCRSCGEKLLRAEYVRFGKIDSAAKEQASGVSQTDEGGEVYSWMHKPCPYCNEPRPLSRKWKGWLVIAAFVLVFGFGIWMEIG